MSEATLASIWDEFSEAERGGILALVTIHRPELHMATLPFLSIGEAAQYCKYNYGSYADNLYNRLNARLPEDYWEKCKAEVTAALIKARAALDQRLYGGSKPQQINPQYSQDAVWDGKGWKEV